MTGVSGSLESPSVQQPAVAQVLFAAAECSPQAVQLLAAVSECSLQAVDSFG